MPPKSQPQGTALSDDEMRVKAETWHKALKARAEQAQLGTGPPLTDLEAEVPEQLKNGDYVKMGLGEMDFEEVEEPKPQAQLLKAHRSLAIKGGFESNTF